MPPKVWKTENTVYYTRILKYPNRWGNTETACTRKEVYWNVRLDDGKILKGFDTKKAALAVAAEIERKEVAK